MAMSNATKEKFDIGNTMCAGSTCVPVRPWELTDTNLRDRKPQSPTTLQVGSNCGGKSINSLKGVSTAAAAATEEEEEKMTACELSSIEEHGEDGLQRSSDDDHRKTLLKAHPLLAMSTDDIQHEPNTDYTTTGIE